MNNPEELASISGKDLGRIETEDGIDPFQIVDIDPILISSRHLFRMPYSLNRGTGNVSLPINYRDLEEFEKDHASPRGLRVRKMFLQPGEEGEASVIKMVSLLNIRFLEALRCLIQVMSNLGNITELKRRPNGSVLSVPHWKLCNLYGHHQL